MSSGGGLRIFFSSLVFVVTGLIQTVCIQAVLYSGGGDRSTFLLAIPNYIGIVAVHFLGARCFKLLDRFGVWSSGGHEASRVHLSVYTLSKAEQQLPFFARVFHPDRRKLFVLAFNELAGFLTGLTGLSIAGSGLYQVVFSGATVFTALLTTFFLRKRLTMGQWASVACITLGLMITAEQVTHTASDSAAAASLISGLTFVLVSCLFYSTNYVICEHFLERPPPSAESNSDEDIPSTLPPPSGLDLSLYTGGTCFILFSVYILLHTIPNWNLLVTTSIQRHHGNTIIIMEHYLYLTIASFFHAISHYDVVATVGAVPIGVLNALRAVSVFAASSALFCTQQASQCYNSRKGVSTAVVVCGALAYSVASAMTGRKGKKLGYTKAARSELVTARRSRRGTSTSAIESLVPGSKTTSDSEVQPASSVDAVRPSVDHVVAEPRPSSSLNWLSLVRKWRSAAMAVDG